jgi:hypothetical protein
MKKLILILFIFHHQLSGQGVGINILSPDPSAALHINSSNKGVLLPRVWLKDQNDISTVANPAHGLLVFNTSSNLPNGAGFYFNSGESPGFPIWKKVSDWSLPIYKVTSVTGAAFQIENYQGGPDAIAIQGYGMSERSGVFASSSSGKALVVDGKMQISGNGQVPGQGKVLTSSGVGNAFWKGAVAFSANGIQSGKEQLLPGYNKIAFGTERYDLKDNYTDANQVDHSTFTAPTKGIYHFDVMVTLTSSGKLGQHLYFVRFRNGVYTEIETKYEWNLNGNNSVGLSCDVLLEASDQIFFNILHNKVLSDPAISLLTGPESAYFNGRLITVLE